MKNSVMLEGYCADIERLVREGTLRPAIRLSVALPDICAALEDAQLNSSPEQYAAWCTAWLSWKAVSGGKSIDGARLYGLYTLSARTPTAAAPDESSGGITSGSLRRLRMMRRARRERTLVRRRVWQPSGRLQGFQVDLIEALVDGSRRWYRDQGADSALVQKNLGRLLVSG